MIERLRGELIEKESGHVVLMTGGVGYGLDIPVSTFERLPRVGGQADLFVHTHVREESLDLFGFATREEREAFEVLLTVSGIGPGMALAILSSQPLARFVEAVGAGDVDALTSIKGVGRKTAERLILELKSKLKGYAWAAPSSGEGPIITSHREARNAISALVNLGMKQAQAERAVSAAAGVLGDSASLEELIVEGLKKR